MIPHQTIHLRARGLDTLTDAAMADLADRIPGMGFTSRHGEFGVVFRVAADDSVTAAAEYVVARMQELCPGVVLSHVDPMLIGTDALARELHVTPEVLRDWSAAVPDFPTAWGYDTDGREDIWSRSEVLRWMWVTWGALAGAGEPSARETAEVNQILRKASAS